MSPGQSKPEFKVTEEECRRLEEALKDPEFMRLFRDYAEEIQAPEARAVYEKEIEALELERGNKIRWVHPEPRFAIELSVKNVYVNYAASPEIERPEPEPSKPLDGACDSRRRKTRWRIPLSVTAPRADVLHVPGNINEATKVTIYDVVYHPAAFDIPNSQQDLILTGLETLVQQKFDVKLSHDYAVLKEPKYIGAPKSTVIRDHKGTCTKASSSVDFVVEKLSDVVPPSTLRTPELRVIHVEDSGLASHSFSALDGAPSAKGPKPRKLSVRATLDTVESGEEINVVVSDDKKSISINVPGKFGVATAALPFPIVADSCRAKWNLSSRQITIDVVENRNELKLN